MLFALSLQLRALWLGLQGSRNKTQLPPAGGEGGSPAGLASGQSDLLFQSLVSLVLTMPLKLCCPPPPPLAPYAHGLLVAEMPTSVSLMGT